MHPRVTVTQFAQVVIEDGREAPVSVATDERGGSPQQDWIAPDRRVRGVLRRRRSTECFARAAHTDQGCRVTAKMLQVSIAEMIAQKPYACEIFGRALQVGQLRAMCESPEFHYPNRRNVRRRCT